MVQVSNMETPVKPVRGTEGSSEEGVSKGGFKQFGQRLKEEFPFDPEWRNLNHGESTL